MTVHRPPGQRANVAARELVHEIVSGERVDGFRVGELLYEGGMARLYRVSRPRERRLLVMKVPKLGPQAPVSAYAAFENEWRILERLRGPYVPRLVAVGDPGRHPYLVLEYIEGDVLARAAAQAPLPIERVRDLGVRLCRAVHDLHRQNVIHLDLNPRNVRDRAGGEMVLVDFGVAHHAALPDHIDAAFGEEEGTTPYISPEQVRHVRSEPRSDLYAIGAILYQLATGHYPLGRPNLLSLKKRLFEPAPPPRCYNPDIPPWLQEIILRCLAIRPEQRYPTARQVAYLLSHPEAVHLTARARRTRRAGMLTRARLWWRSLYEVFEDTAPRHPQEHLTRHPHVLVALDLAPASSALRYALRDAVRKFARNEPHAYFTFLSVVAREEVREANAGETSANSPAVICLAQMRNWAQPLSLAPERAHFQVIPGTPAAALVEYAQTHAIDHLILGARADAAAGTLLGNVSYRVMARAPCSVTVVRTRRDAQGRASAAGGRKPKATDTQGRASVAGGTTPGKEKVGPRRATARMQEVGQRRERLPEQRPRKPRATDTPVKSRKQRAASAGARARASARAG